MLPAVRRAYLRWSECWEAGADRCPTTSQCFVPALVIERASERGERRTKFPGMRGQLVRIVGFLVLPGFDDCEVVRARLLVHDVKAQIAGILSARFGELLERNGGFVAARRP